MAVLLTAPIGGSTVAKVEEWQGACAICRHPISDHTPPYGPAGRSEVFRYCWICLGVCQSG